MRANDEGLRYLDLTRLSSSSCPSILSTLQLDTEAVVSDIEAVIIGPLMSIILRKIQGVSLPRRTLPIPCSLLSPSSKQSRSR